METINIKIETEGGRTLSAKCGCLQLFLFEYRDDDKKWCFWPNDWFAPTIIEGEEFPAEYFSNLCRAKYFCWTGTDVWPENVKIVAGKKYLKPAPSQR